MQKNLALSGRAVSLLVAMSGLLLIRMNAKAANAYYISASAGRDTNTAAQAQSKNTPWAHLPGMASCTGNCASYTPVPGDTFILKGCDTWTASDLPVRWDWSGTSSSPITVSVDKSWSNSATCPSSWQRPIFDGQNTEAGPFLNLSINATRSYIVFDNIEMKRGTGNGLRYISCYEQCANTTVQNMYLHAWNVTTDGSCVIVAFYGVGNVVQNSVIDGSDATGASPAGATCYAFYAGLPAAIKNNVIHDLANGIVGYAAGSPGPSSIEIGGNLIYNIKESNAGSHPNAIEIVGGGATFYIHDNVIHDNLGESLMFGNSGETDYIWNNVIYNVLGNMPEAPQVPGQTGMSFAAWNNTIVPGSGQQCLAWNSGDGGSFTSVTVQNNHCITTASSVANSSWNGTSATLASNALMTPTQAAAAGYRVTGAYAYSPSSPTCLGQANCPAGVAVNLTNRCSGTMAGLCEYTTYADAMSATPRPSTGAWDAGAYQLGSGGLQAPTDLVAISH